MKKYISYLLTLAIVIPALVSCSVQLEDIFPSQQKRTVHFSSVNQETRTGLTVGEDLVVYDWRKTDIDHVHLFEMDANGQTAYGETIKVTPSTDDLTAHFEADFSSEDMIIHVDPATRAGGTRATERVAPYKYAAVIATKPDTQLSFVVPSVQYPDAETQKDPAAEFLIGYSRKSYEEPTSFDENVVDLYFDRVVSMSRLVISNFKGSGEKVISITINAENGLVGSASFTDIDFENASVNFVRDEGPGILTLNYRDGVSVPTDGAFYAYFVTIPGAAKITSMEVLTDQYRYVRSIEGGKEFTFSEKTFKNISVDLNNATAEELGPAASVYTKVMSTSDIEADGTYVIVYDNGSSSKVFKPIVSNDIVEASANNAISATVSDGVLYGDANIDACQVVLVANGSYYHIKFGDYYIYPSQSNIGAESASSSSTRTMAITISNGVATIKRSAYSHYLTYSNYFLRGGSDTNNLALYKLTTGSTTPPTPDDGGLATYTMVSTLTVGETYLIVDADDNLIFKGNINGSYQSVTPVNGVITDDANGTLSAYEFTVEQNGSDYYLKFNDGKYLVSNWNSPGNGSTGLCYVNTQAEVQYPYALTTDNGAFMFSTTQVNSSTSTDQVLYYKTSENVFKIGGSGRGVGIHLYMKGGLKGRGLKFEPESVTCLQGNTPEKPVLSGIYTTVRYSSDNTSVATVNATNGTVTVTGVGMATITASVEADDDYLAGTASYTLTVLDPNSSSYTKVSSLTVGGTYLIVDADDNLIFKGNINGSYQSVTPVNGVITDDANGTLSAYEFTVEQNDSDYYLKFNDGKYLVSNWNSPGNGSTGLCYVNTQAEVQYPYALTTDNGAFMFSTTQVNSSTSTDQVLYYKTSENVFKIGGSGRGVGIHLYLKGGGGSSSGQQVQSLKFDQTSVTCTLNGTFTQPTLSGAKTTVTYASSNTNVASVDQNTGAVTRKKLGTTIITATAIENEQYLEGKASYTLNIVDPPSGDWVELGPFNLENKALKDYLDDAIANYTDTNDSGTDKVVVMSKYAGSAAAYSSIDRKDCPNPVTITWTNSASSSTVISIYENQSLSSPIWTQNATANSTSAEVYNLIPGRTYYYTVSEGSTIWEKGYFNTTGRRRMLKISDVEAKGHANNCRDLGGMEVTDKGVKKTIKYGYIFRGSNMDKTTTSSSDQTKVAEQTILTDFLNIGMDIDLRSGSSSSSGWNDDGNSNCYRPLPTSVSYINPGFNSWSDLSTVSKIKSVITAFFTTAKSGKASYFHCYVGADRTGYIGMLLEGLLGVSEKDCSIDYELTSFSDAVGLRYRDGSPTDYYFRQGITFLRGQNGDTFQDKIENYLVNTVRISQADIDEFKSIVLQ